jgi:hypothetical protein
MWGVPATELLLQFVQIVSLHCQHARVPPQVGRLQTFCRHETQLLKVSHREQEDRKQQVQRCIVAAWHPVQ